MAYDKTERKCENCSAGSYYRQSMKTNKCEICEYGKYQPNPGQNTCLNCDLNACYEVRRDRTACEYKCSESTHYCNFSGTCLRCDINNNTDWKLVKKIDQSSWINGTLKKGVYKFTITGAKGGDGGRAECMAGSSQSGGRGGNGDVIQKIITLYQDYISYTTYAGSQGGNGSNNSDRYKDGKCGTASGEGGGYATLYGRCEWDYCCWRGLFGKCWGCSRGCGFCWGCHNGYSGSSAGNGQNSGSAYILIHKYIK